MGPSHNGSDFYKKYLICANRGQRFGKGPLLEAYLTRERTISHPVFEPWRATLDQGSCNHILLCYSTYDLVTKAVKTNLQNCIKIGLGSGLWLKTAPLLGHINRKRQPGFWILSLLGAYLTLGTFVANLSKHVFGGSELGTWKRVGVLEGQLQLVKVRVGSLRHWRFLSLFGDSFQNKKKQL